MVYGLVQTPSVRVFDAFASRGQQKLCSDDLICTISTYISTSISSPIRVANAALCVYDNKHFEMMRVHAKDLD